MCSSVKSSVLSVVVFSIFAIFGCASTLPPPAPGGNFDLKNESPAAQKAFHILKDYLKEKYPDVSDLIIVSAQSQVVEGTNTTLICQYEQQGSSLYLKALLHQPLDGEQRVVKVYFFYAYNREE